MSRTGRTLVGAVVLALTAIACGASGEAEEVEPAERAEVRVEGFLFHPLEATIRRGQTVTWRNRDQILHTATSGEPGAPTGLFDGVMSRRGDSFSFRFDEPGTLAYFCERHNHMRGTIVVTE